MSRLQGSSFVGLEFNDVRPRSKVTAAKVIQLAEDISCIYEEATNSAHPGATIAATAHDHMAVGAPMRRPLFHWRPNADLRPREEGWTGTPGWFPFQAGPAYIPSWCASIKVVFIIDSPFTLKSIRVRVLKESLSELFISDEPTVIPDGHWMHPNCDDRIAAWVDVTVEGGECNVIEIQAWDGEQGEHEGAPPLPVTGPGARRVFEVLGLPVERAPVQVQPAPSLAFNSSTDHLVPSAFIPLEGAMIAVDRSLNSFVLGAFLKNTNMVRELVTGRPAGNRSTLTFDHGHNHKNNAASNLAESGADVDLPLLSCCYGVARLSINDGGLSAGVGDLPADDTTNDWYGKIPAPWIDAGSTATEVIARHPFRMPDLTAANAGLTGGATKLKVWWYVYENIRASGDVTPSARIGNKIATTFATAASPSAISGAGEQKVLVSASINAQAVQSLQVLETRLTQGATESQAAALLGVALAYVA